MNTEERMDAMTPNGDAVEPVSTPVALRHMADSLARQVELGIVLEQAHQSEVRAHRNTKLRLANMETAYRRLQNANEEVNSKLDLVRNAIAGDVFGHTASPDGDAVAEARELYAKAYNMEAELLNARDLLERAIPSPEQNGLDREPWDRLRDEWAERVDSILHPETHNPEEGNGESHS